MIYFDADKKAYAYEIPNYIAKIEDGIKKGNLLSQILTLEASQARSIRELYLDFNNETAKTKLESIEAQIQDLRAEIARL